MKLSRRSFPHPVIGNGDDVPGTAFQATVVMTGDKENIYLDVSIQHSSEQLESLISEQHAACVVHVECTNTLYRNVFTIDKSPAQITIRSDQLNDGVEVNTFAVATTDLPGYVVIGAHADYSGASFDVRKGDILAVAEGHVFFVENSADVLGRIGSIMQIEGSDTEGDRPLVVDYSTDKIRVILSKPDFATYKMVRNDEHLSAIITTAIVLPVLVDTIHFMGGSAEDWDEGSKWYQIISRRIAALGPAASTEPLLTAQKLLELPVKRALATGKSAAENASL